MSDDGPRSGLSQRRVGEIVQARLDALTRVAELEKQVAALSAQVNELQSSAREG